MGKGVGVADAFPHEKLELDKWLSVALPSLLVFSPCAELVQIVVISEK